jgi:hypothetical protein
MMKLMFVVIALFVAGGCKKKSEGVGSEAEKAMAKMTELKDEMCRCKDAKCAQDVSDKLAKWSQAQPPAKGGKPAKTSEEETKKLAAIGDEMGKCMATAMTASAPPADPATPPPAGSASADTSAVPALPAGLPVECTEYRTQVEKIQPCDKLPPKAKEALLKGYADAVKGWAVLPEGAKEGLKTSCKAGTEAVVLAAKEACGW